VLEEEEAEEEAERLLLGTLALSQVSGGGTAPAML
jgi:hypothetical protein